MKNQTRQCFNQYLSTVARLNAISQALGEKFAVEPSVQQRLENKIQESSAFLGQINLVPVTEQQGQTLGLGIANSIASTTDTTQAERKTQDLHTLEENHYFCQQINYDSHIRYATLDMWAKFADFGKRIADLKNQRIALDRIMIGFNGTQRAKTSNRSQNPLLQDVAVGWLEKVRTNAAKRHMKEVDKGTGKIEIGKGQHYQNLDALVYSAVSDLIEPWYQDDTGLVAIMGRDLLADKYFPLVNDQDKPSEKLAADLIISQKRVGGLQAIRVPFMPTGTILITRLDNLSIYYQEGAMRRTLIDNPKADRIEDYLSSNDDYVIENYECVALLENISFKDKEQ